MSVASCPNAEIIYCNIIFKRCKFIHWVWVWLIERVYIWQVRVWDSHLCCGPALGGRWHKSNIGFGWSGNIASCLGHKQKLNRLFDHRENISPALLHKLIIRSSHRPIVLHMKINLLNKPNISLCKFSIHKTWHNTLSILLFILYNFHIYLKVSYISKLGKQHQHMGTGTYGEPQAAASDCWAKCLLIVSDI